MRLFPCLVGLAVASIPLSAAMAIQPRTLNEPSRSTESKDVASFKSGKKIPYEAQHDDVWWVAYSLVRNPDIHAYRLTLMMQNKSEVPKEVEPRISVVDADGVPIDIAQPQDMIAMGSLMAGMPIPPRAPVGMYQSYTGTARSITTGERYSVQVQPGGGGFAGSFASSFAQGYANAQRSAALQRAEAGFELTRWVRSFWLRSPLNFEPNGYRYGSVMFEGPDSRPLPIKVVVEIEGSRFEFLTRAK